MSQDDWAWNGTIYSIGLVIAQVPATILMKWATPRWHFIRIVLLWSLACACQAAAVNMGGLLATRFLLGIFEAGLYPGIMVYLTYWYRPAELGVRYAALNVLGQFSGILDALITYGFEYVHGSLYPWQYVFILEGLLGVLVSAGLYFLLPDFPDTARFLTPDERDFVQARLPPNAARATDADFSWKEMRMAVTDPLTWLFTFLELFYNSGTYGLSYWLPTVIAGWGFKGTAQKQLLNIPPSALYVIIGVLGSWLTDRSTSIPRPYFLLQNSVIIMGLYGGLAYCRSLGGLYAIILILQGFAGWSINIYWPWRAQTLKGASYAATAIAFQNSLAGLSGFYTPHLFQAKYKPYYQVPFFICFAFFGACALVCLATWYATYDVERDTRRVAAAQRKAGKLNNENIADDIEVDRKIVERTY
ncbi:hypothetical protein JCM6882_006481 [Rhodosporidiobolus microsporus]